MTDCAHCGRALGLFHHDLLCDSCQAAEKATRLEEATRALGQMRASGGTDEAARGSFARLLEADAKDALGIGDRDRTVRGLAVAAVEDEIRGTLASDDPTGDRDAQMEGFVIAIRSLLPDDVDLAKTVQPHMLELELREIGRGRLPSVQSVGIPLEGEEQAVFADHVELLEPSPVRGTKGVIASTRVRVSNDVWVRLGGFGAESSPKRVEMHSTDRGTLTVTTKRVAYIGAARTVQFARADVLTTVTDAPTLRSGPSITFHFKGRRNPVGFRLAPDGARLLDAILNYRPATLANPAAPSPPEPPTQGVNEAERRNRQPWWKS